MVSTEVVFWLQAEDEILIKYTEFRGIFYCENLAEFRPRHCTIGKRRETGQSNRSVCWSGHVYPIGAWAAPGHIYTTGARAAPELVWTKGFCASLDMSTNLRPELHQNVLHYSHLLPIWTCQQNWGLSCSWTCQQKLGPELHLDVSTLQRQLAAPGRPTYTTGAWAAPGRVRATGALAAPGRVYTKGAWASHGRI